MSEITFVSKKRNMMIADGNHKATIVSISDSIGKTYGTPQIVVSYKTANGNIKQWFNLVGYKKDAEGNYVLKNNKRQIDDDNTQAAMDIFGGFMHDAGIEEGKNLSKKQIIKEFTGKELGITVGSNNFGDKAVTNTMSLDRLLELEEAGEELVG